MTEILIRVKLDESNCYDEYDRGELKQEVVTFDQLLKEQPEYMFQHRGYALIDPKQGKISQQTADLLRQHGWVHMDTAKDREERKVVEQEYYLLDEKGSPYGFYDAKFKKINIDNLTEHELKQLARSAKIVQVVGPKSVLPAAQYKKLQTKRKQLEEQRQRAKDAAVTKAAKKKQKEIEADKLLLQEVDEV